MQIASVFVNHFHTEDTPQVKADGDPGDAAGQRSGERERKREVAHVDKVPGKGEHRLVGNRKSDDAEHQEEEDSEVSVVRDPGEDLLFH